MVAVAIAELHKIYWGAMISIDKLGGSRPAGEKVIIREASSMISSTRHHSEQEDGIAVRPWWRGGGRRARLRQ
jgi:hypothetical protein